MSSPNPAPPAPAWPLVFERRLFPRNLALLGLLLGVFATAAGGLFRDRSIGELACAGSLACLALQTTARLFRRSGFALRLTAHVFSAVVAAGIPEAFGRGHFPLLAASAVLSAVHAALVVIQGACRVEVGHAGLARERRGLFASRSFIPWNEVRSATADAFVTVTYSPGQSLPDVERQDRVRVEGGGLSLEISSSLYRWLGREHDWDFRWVREILARAEPEAVLWTLLRLESAGRVDLGAVRLTRTELAWRGGLGGWRRAALDGSLRVGVERGRLIISGNGVSGRVNLRDVANGPYLPAIVARLAAPGPAPSSAELREALLRFSRWKYRQTLSRGDPYTDRPVRDGLLGAERTVDGVPLDPDPRRFLDLVLEGLGRAVPQSQQQGDEDHWESGAVRTIVLEAERLRALLAPERP
jgi:hypothetical protein